MTARLESFLARVESGAEKIVARALRGFRYRKPLAPNPAPAPTPPAPASAGPLVVERSNAAEAELPETYGRSRVVVLAIDPYHVHAYWELTPQDASDARARLDRFGLVTPSWVLRFYDVTGVDSGGVPESLVEHAHFDIEIDPGSRSWYVELWSPDKTYIVELGVRVPDRFSAVCRANPVHVPPAEASPPEAPEWRKADPEHATTHPVAPAELPAYGVSTFDEREAPQRREPSGAAGFAPPPFGAAVPAPNLGGEQPWVLASGGLAPEARTEDANAAFPAPNPDLRFAAPNGKDAAGEARQAALPERSRSISLRVADSTTGQRPGSGGARAGDLGGDSSE